MSPGQSTAAQPPHLPRKPSISSIYDNCRCRSWSSRIVEVVLVTSSPNKKGPSPPILLLLHVRRPPALLAAPLTLRPVPVHHLAISTVQRAAPRRWTESSRANSSPCPCSTDGCAHAYKSDSSTLVDIRAFWPKPLEETTEGAHVLTIANSLGNIKVEAVVLGQCTITWRRLQDTQRSSASATCFSDPLPSAGS